MIPILFDKTETQFTSNGKGRLVDCISCTVTEERNGIYECEFQYPINGRLYPELLQGGTIGVIHDDNHDIQPFDIYTHTGDIEGVVTFHAHHISYRQTNIVVGQVTGWGASGALANIIPESINTNPFNYSTDKTDLSVYYHPSGHQQIAFRSARGYLMGQDYSILDVFGGEYKFDKFNVSLLNARGQDTGVTIRHGKNLTGIEWTLDRSELYNAIAPFTFDGVGTAWLGGGDTIVTPTTPIYPIVPVVMDVSQMITEPWLETVGGESKSKIYARQYLDTKRPWIPKVTISLDFVAMWQTDEYKQVADIQKIQLCDTVSIYWTEMGIVAEKAKVTKTVFNVLTERLDQIEIGQPLR